jgi:hypothetical protein
MPPRRRLTANARTWLTLAIALLLTGPLFALRSCVATQSDDERVVISSSDNDRLVSFKNGTTMLLEKGSIGRRLADWARVGTNSQHRIALGDETFEPGTADPTHDGSLHIAQFAQLLEAHPDLTTQIFVTRAKGAVDAAEDRLEHFRADRLRDRIVAHGVPADKIVSVARPVEVQTRRASEHPHLLIVLERRV